MNNKLCNHEGTKVYAPYILTSNPPQSPWVCSKCGEQGVGRQYFVLQEEFQKVTIEDLLVKKLRGI